MGLMDQAQADVKQILENSCDWGDDMTFTAALPSVEVANIQGLRTKHHLAIDDQGVPFNDRVASVAVSDASFPVSYPLYDAEGNVKLRKHLVTVKDSTGADYTYAIKEWFPDRALGLIVCILGTYK